MSTSQRRNDESVVRKNRRQAAERYAAYKFLCKRVGSSPIWGDWQAHHLRLRDQLGLAEIGNERNEYKRYWLRRFTLAEIHAISAGIGELSAPDHSTYVTPTRRRLAA